MYIHVCTCMTFIDRWIEKSSSGNTYIHTYYFRLTLKSSGFKNHTPTHIHVKLC